MAKDMPTWYHGGITGDEATKILTRFKQPGAFLLRDSQNKKGTFTLTVSRSIGKADHVVYVKHYRITKSKNRLDTWKSGRKNFPSLKDLEKCVHQQEEGSGETLSHLGMPVQMSMIEEWDRTDPRWRDKFKVKEQKHDKHNRVSPKAKDLNKHASKFPRFISRKKKQHESNVTEENCAHVQMQASNSRDGEVGKEPKRNYSGSSKNAAGNNDGIYTVNKDRNHENAFNKANDSETQPADDDNSDGNDWDSNTLSQQITRKDKTVETIDESSNRSNDMGNVNIGIYSMSTVGRNTRNSVVLRSREVNDGGSFNQLMEFNNGINMSSEQATTKENKEQEPHKHSVASSSVSHNNQSNSGIYLSSEHVTTIPRSPKVGASSSVNDNNAFNSGIYLSSEQATNKDNKMPGSHIVGVSSSVSKDNASESGIYLSSEHVTTIPRSHILGVYRSVGQNEETNGGIHTSLQQASTKDNDVPNSHNVSGCGNVKQDQRVNRGIYMSPEQIIIKDNKATRSGNLSAGSSADQDKATNSGVYM